jgi:hypothetical protein
MTASPIHRSNIYVNSFCILEPGIGGVGVSQRARVNMRRLPMLNYNIYEAAEAQGIQEHCPEHCPASPVSTYVSLMGHVSKLLWRDTLRFLRFTVLLGIFLV